jgi:hypothetical protein
MYLSKNLFILIAKINR